MSHKPELAEFTNMCMIYDDNGNVLVQERIKSWCGYAFPGGHLELKESIVDSVIREIKEETGLDISNLELCGVKQWFNEENGRNVCFLYKTNNYTGELNSTDEGRNFWLNLEELKGSDKLAETFRQMLEVFTDDKISEQYHVRINGERHIELK